MAVKLNLYMSLEGVADAHAPTQTQKYDSVRLTISLRDEIGKNDRHARQQESLTFDSRRQQLDCASEELNGSALSAEEVLLLTEILSKVRREFHRAYPHLIVDGQNSSGCASGDLELNPLLPTWLEEARNILDAEFTERPKLYEIAAKVGIHPVHLARQFRKYFGSSVRQYVCRLRVEFACRQLLASNAPPAQIASAAGFSDQSHFSRTFKRFQGMTPGRYRALRSL